MTRTICLDFDDLCDNTIETLDLVDDLARKYDNFKCTLFAIPARMSPRSVSSALSIPGVQLAPHGWRHTKGECLGWTDIEAKEKIEAAAAMGIDAPVFRAPAWLLDKDVYDACEELGYVVASHNVFRVPMTEVREYVYNIDSVIYKAVHGHLSHVCDNYIEDMVNDGRLRFGEDDIFAYPQDLATIHIDTGVAACAP